MVTEMLGILIVIGTVMVLLLRHFLGKREEAKVREERAKQQEIGAAAIELRRELERAADGIIDRMGERVDHLEQLIAEAGRREAALRARIRELEAKEERIPETSFESALANHMDETVGMALPAHVESIELARTKIEAATMRAAAHVSVETFRDERAPVLEDDAEEAPAEGHIEEYAEEREAYAVGSIAETSLEGTAAEDVSFIAERAGDAAEAVPEDASTPLQAEERAAQETSAGDAPQAKAPSPREVAAALLQDGMDVEEVARATGIGRGALELLRRMQVK